MSIVKYVLRRALFLIPVFFGITLLVFSIERLAGDPVQLLTALNPRVNEAQRQALRHYYGLDKPVYVQYLIWVQELFLGDLGSSFAVFNGVSVNYLIATRTWTTLEIQFLGLVF